MGPGIGLWVYVMICNEMIYMTCNNECNFNIVGELCWWVGPGCVGGDGLVG